MTTKLVIELAGDDLLPKALESLLNWWNADSTSLRSHGQWVRVGEGSDPAAVFTWRITGIDTWEDTGAEDLTEQVPAVIGISKIGDDWYLGSTHGDPGGYHEHVEIKLDRERLEMLRADLEAQE